MALVLLGLVCGVISGLALGGGTLLVPALIITMGFSQHMAQGISLASFLPTSLVAVITHYRHGNVDTRLAFSLAVTSVIGAVGGSYLAHYISAQHLRQVFGFFLIIMGLYEIFNRKKVH
ncbi:sulfite exporter TauE/SafE family protein [Thermincola potens]|uniref:Probable membrane transporter protein n=1 Tax=Thermincola potens (strain JR) TaxID=635013 RepID=D5XEW7_THEPJ|nr:sulfite exporter TauE/SafE family protein [Thermincola potens]ADG82188.1 protein of unknown function DUF81 [Thermincola potens JR]